jgi:hypothetical protein
MNLKDTIHNLLGVGDGEGNTSLMRIILLLIALTVLVPKVVLALKNGTPVDFSTGDLEVLAIALGAKLVQNVQEANPQPKKP